MKFNEFVHEDYDLFPGVAEAGDVEPLISEEFAFDTAGTAFVVVDGNGVHVFAGDETRGMTEYRVEGPTAALALAHLTVASGFGTVTTELLAALGFVS